ncbi:MAG: sulfate ABC transporter permease subunit CysT [Gloeobacterales cyanobacterium]
MKISRRTSLRSGLVWGLALAYLGLLLFLPMAGLFLKTLERPLPELWALVMTPVAVETYKLTFGGAFIAAFINMFFGVVLAWILVRYDFPGKRLADGLIDLPFAIPTAVAGLTLAVLYGPGGVLGQFLDPGTPLGSLFAFFGIQEVRLAYSQFGVVLAMTFVTVPFVVRTVQPVLLEIEPALEEAASSLGATNGQTFRLVILPQLLPSILTGFTLAFARAIGEYGSVVLISGNLPFDTLTTPVYIFQRLEEFDYAGATAVSVVLLTLSLVILFSINTLQAWSRRYDS